MRFQMLRLPCDFELPDEWLDEVGFFEWKKQGEAYRSLANVTLIPLHDVMPHGRSHNVPHDWRGFEKSRMVDILRGIVQNVELPAVPVRHLPPLYIGQRIYEFEPRDGTHRFFASVAAGFTKLPCFIDD